MAKPHRGALNSPPRKTTLKDVARLCGVTSMTVSKYLNKKGGVSEATAEKIRLAVRQLNYTPNLVAKSLRMNKTQTIGVVISDSSQLLLTRMLQGIDDEAFASGYSIIMANTNQNPERERECITTLLNKRIDGLILAAPRRFDVDVYNEVAGFGIPLVLMMRPSSFPVDIVVSDNRGGGYALAKHLIETGSRRLYAINLPLDNSSGRERMEGIRRALADCGLGREAIGEVNVEPTMEAGRAAMEALLEEGFSGDTVLCGCDLIAVGAMRAAFGRGARIPDDFRLCGYDDIDMMDNLAVPLTTMRQQVYAMGREGMRLLLKRMDEPSRPPEHRRFPCELVVREST